VQRSFQRVSLPLAHRCGMEIHLEVYQTVKGAILSARGNES
jgi:hypothetical protein